MKKIVLITALIISVNVNAQKGGFIVSKWNRNIDAGFVVSPADYSLIKKGHIYYSISNNSEFIFLFLKIADLKVQDILLKEGLTLWVNMDNKPARKMGIRFPDGSQSPGARNKQSESDPSSDSYESPDTPVSLANTIELIGFMNENVRRFPAENSDSFRGSVRIDDKGIFYYRMDMPIEKLPMRNSKSGKGSSPFALGIEYGALSLKIDHNNYRATSGSQFKSKPVIFWIKNIILVTDR